MEHLILVWIFLKFATSAEYIRNIIIGIKSGKEKVGNMGKNIAYFLKFYPQACKQLKGYLM